MNPLTSLSAGRIVAGASTLLAPSLTGSALGIGGPVESHLAARMFGAREIALGLGALTLSGDQRRGALLVGIVADLGDIVAAALGGRQGTTPRPQAIGLGVLAAGAVVVGIQARGA